VEVVVSLSQGRTAAAQCGLFTYKSVPVIFEPPCSFVVNCKKGKFLVHQRSLFKRSRIGLRKSCNVERRLY